MVAWGLPALTRPSICRARVVHSATIGPGCTRTECTRSCPVALPARAFSSGATASLKLSEKPPSIRVASAITGAMNFKNCCVTSCEMVMREISVPGGCVRSCGGGSSLTSGFTAILPSPAVNSSGSKSITPSPSFAAMRPSQSPAQTHWPASTALRACRGACATSAAAPHRRALQGRRGVQTLLDRGRQV